MKTLFRLSFFAALLPVLAACSQEQLPSTLFIREAGEADVSEVPAGKDSFLAELTSDSGSTFVFVDEGLSIKGGGVGVLELTAPGREAALPALAKGFQPTALELYLALAPESASAPERLVEAHRSLAAAREDVTAEPRELRLPVQTSNIVGPMYREWCANATAFETNFHNSFFDLLDYKYEGYGLNLIGNKVGTTGVAARRALAACNNPLHTPFASETPVKVKVEAQIGANLWAYVPGTSRTLGNQEGMYYLSEGLQAQRYRVVAKPHHYAIYHLAGAWGKE